MWSLYVPNGREIDHPHYTYKLQWLARLREAGEAWLSEDPKAQIALCGDWNIAPYDEDVWDMAEFEGRTHVTKPERDAFHAVVDAGFTDVVRPHAPGPGVYTYWDYKGLAFPKRKGMRIDFILASPRSPSGPRTRRSTARNAKAKARPITPLSSLIFSLTEPFLDSVGV